MSAIFNKLSRRGKKNAYETQLDPKWGDVSITSPTEPSQIWHVKSPQVDIHSIPESILELNEEITPIEDSNCASVRAAAISLPYPKQKHEGNKVPGQPFSNVTFPPTPLQTPMQSPSLASSFCASDSQRSNSLSEHPNIRINTQVQSCDSSKYNVRSGNAFGVNGIVSPATTVLSPTSTTEEAFAQSQTHTSVAVNQSFPAKSEPLAHSPSSSIDLQAIVYRPRRVDNLLQDHTPALVHPSYTSLNAAAIESVHLSRAEVLTPKSDSFPESVHGSEDGEVTIVAERVATSGQQPVGTESVPENWPFVYQDIVERREPVSPFVAPRPQRVPDNQTLALLEIQTPGLPKIPGTPMLIDERREQTYVDENSHARSLSTTTLNQSRSPTLGSCGRMRMQPLHTNTAKSNAAHSRDTSVDSSKDVHTKVNTIRPLKGVQRQRSSSLEPPPSPAFFDVNRSNVPNFSTNSGQSIHRRLQSDSNNYCDDDISSPYESIPTAYHSSQQIDNDTTSLSKRSRSQVPFVSPDLRKRQAFSNSPQLNNLPVQRKPSSGGLYDDIRNDFRVVSREARIAKNVEMLSKFTAKEPANDDRPKQKSRSRSASRVKDRSNMKQATKEEKVSFQPAQLVPSYREMWE